MVWFHMVILKMPLTMSAAPASARQRKIAQMLGITAARATETPHSAAARITPDALPAARAPSTPL
ncbi:hypothetical protein GCM10020219_004110 [Nonomuraea dietziae]